MRTEPAFHGAKLLLLTGDSLISLLRDDVPHIPWPGYWDFPGGEREGDESPAACALRETHEELGLSLAEERLTWRRVFHNQQGRAMWFFAARIAAQEVEQIVFGDEGQGWAVMRVADYLSHPKTIPPLQDRLRDYLAEVGAGV
ncbi:NUDIX hydrolase [Rhodovulum adriaticum]|uniref:8-oxo-dGTP diphosphatase n=1 Tax=Rhodovulum adriaticum TaxID=35804 RepID=A0A4R2NZC8_RHOAD|nr:NUDIX hydrolase [Rhodovulum adriaticum]MBK1637222.1 DNA mismatch repair protein MutT [Rhodovulum adriaticum]TCP27108.1 8-oxo-dGTP diphosphatase [Rhodovulum adriaticum]